MKRLVFFTALVVTALPIGRAVAASAAEEPKGCPEAQHEEMLLKTASEAMAGARYQEGIDQLGMFAATTCDARMSLLLAGAYEGSVDPGHVVTTLEVAHRRWPENTSIAASLAREYLGRNEAEKAVAALDSFHATEATPPQEMEEAVVVYITGHRLQKAQAMAAAGYRRYPTLRFLLLLANTLQLQGRYKDVNTVMATKREAYGRSAAFLITAAESEFDAMLYDAAKKDLEAAVLLDDASYQAHFLLGNTLLAQGARDQAAEEYRKAIMLSPKQPRTYYQLALISRARQDEVEEEKLLTQALAVDDHYAPAFCEEGRILFEKHQLEDAVKQLKLAIQYNPQNEEAYYLLARAYAGMGEKEMSQTMVQQYKKIRAANQRSTTDTHAGQIGASETSQP